MSILRESYLYHLWAVLCTVYYDSAVHRCLVRMGAWWQPPDRREPCSPGPVSGGRCGPGLEESILCRC